MIALAPNRPTLPVLLRALIPATALCVLAGPLLPAPAQAQSERPAPVGAPPAVEGAAPPAVEAPAVPGLEGAERRRAAPADPSGLGSPASADVGETLLTRALEGSPGPDGPSPDLDSLRDLLPRALYHDVLRLRDRVVRARSHVFGRRGIVSLGEADDDGEVGRLRLNLQYDPDPGIRVTLVTR